jgi:hypothetical protein
LYLLILSNPQPDEFVDAWDAGIIYEETNRTLLCSDLLINTLAKLKPKTLATMHGSSFNGDCHKALIDLNLVMKEIWGKA